MANSDLWIHDDRRWHYMRRFRASFVLRLAGMLAVLAVTTPRSEADSLFGKFLSWILYGDVTAPVETWSDEYAAARVVAALPEYSSQNTTLSIQALARMTQLASEGRFAEASAVAASAAASGTDPIATMVAAKLSLRVPGLPQDKVKGAIADLVSAGGSIASNRIAAMAYVDAASATQQHLAGGQKAAQVRSAIDRLASAEDRLSRTRSTNDAERLATGVLWSEVANVWARLAPAAADVGETPDAMQRAVGNAEAMLKPLVSAGGSSLTRAAAQEDLRRMHAAQQASPKKPTPKGGGGWQWQ
jgi:hypothetical protein